MKHFGGDLRIRARAFRLRVAAAGRSVALGVTLLCGAMQPASAEPGVVVHSTAPRAPEVTTSVDDANGRAPSPAHVALPLPSEQQPTAQAAPVAPEPAEPPVSPSPPAPGDADELAPPTDAVNTLSYSNPGGPPVIDPADANPDVLAQYEPVLSPYGDWRDDPAYGQVWVPDPAAVGEDFAPYVTAGHWELTTDNDWRWNSDYSFGWLVFHYGRWAWLPSDEWGWIPGARYSNAWVSYRVPAATGDAYVGWAALPPRWVWRDGVAVELVAAPAAQFVFVASPYLFSYQLGHYVVYDPLVVHYAVFHTGFYYNPFPYYPYYWGYPWHVWHHHHGPPSVVHHGRAPDYAVARVPVHSLPVRRTLADPRSGAPRGASKPKPLRTRAHQDGDRVGSRGERRSGPSSNERSFNRGPSARGSSTRYSANGLGEARPGSARHSSNGRGEGRGFEPGRGGAFDRQPYMRRAASPRFGETRRFSREDAGQSGFAMAPTVRSRSEGFERGIGGRASNVGAVAPRARGGSRAVDNAPVLGANRGPRASSGVQRGSPARNGSGVAPSTARRSTHADVGRAPTRSAVQQRPSSPGRFSTSSGRSHGSTRSMSFKPMKGFGRSGRGR